MIEALLLTCSLQAVSSDGLTLVGPMIEIQLEGPAHSQLYAEAGEVSLKGADSLGIARHWKTFPAFHGAVELIATEKSDPKFGLLVPHKKGDGFDIFWATSERRQPNGAPNSVVSGNCIEKTPDGYPGEEK